MGAEQKGAHLRAVVHFATKEGGVAGVWTIASASSAVHGPLVKSGRNELPSWHGSSHPNVRTTYVTQVDGHVEALPTSICRRPHWEPGVVADVNSTRAGAGRTAVRLGAGEQVSDGHPHLWQLQRRVGNTRDVLH